MELVRFVRESCRLRWQLTSFLPKGKTGFFFAPICGLTCLWAYFRVPEFKDRSYYELDVLFERGVSARKFRQTEIERDADENIRAAEGIATHTGEQIALEF